MACILDKVFVAALLLWSLDCTRETWHDQQCEDARDAAEQRLDAKYGDPLSRAVDAVGHDLDAQTRWFDRWEQTANGRAWRSAVEGIEDRYYHCRSSNDRWWRANNLVVNPSAVDIVKWVMGAMLVGSAYFHLKARR